MSMRSIVVGLGEVLWDVFPDGAKFGGAPANFACNMSAIAGDRMDVYVVSGVGRDELGTRALEFLREHGVHTSCIQVSDKPTGTVLVQVDNAGHASYEFAADTAWDNLSWTRDLESLAERAAVVCFGTLGQRSETSRQVVERFVRATKPDCLRVLDINLRPPFWNEQVVRSSLPLAHVLKLNDAELPIVADLLRLRGSDRELLSQLRELYHLRLVTLTRGAAGALLLDAAGNWSEMAGEEVTVADTVGAGDAFTATMIAGLLAELPLDTINAWANRVAAFVSTQTGATPRIPAALRTSSTADRA